MKAWRFLCFGLALLLLQGSAVGAVRAADPPYEINVIISLTGGAAFLGQYSQSALRLIESSVNAEGGVRGRPIKFVIADDKSDPQTALQLANAVIAKKVPFFMGPGLAATCNAVLAQIVNSGPLMYCYSPILQAPDGSYGYSSGSAISAAVVATIRYLRLRGWNRLAVVTSTDSTGQEGDHDVDAALALAENKGVTVVDREHFNPADISVVAQMSHVKASGAQAVFVWTTGAPFGTALHGAFDAGLQIPIATTAGNQNYTQLQSYDAFMGDDLYMITTPSFVPPDILPRGGMQQSVKRYLALLDAAHLKNEQGYATAWDPTLLMIDVLRHVGFNATASDTRQYLNSVSGWAGLNGIYDFKRVPQRGVGPDYLYMVDWNKTTHSFSAVSGPGGIPKR